MTPLRVARTMGAVVVMTIWVDACGETIRGCQVSANPAAQSAAIAVQVNKPYRCDYTVESPGSVVQLLAEFAAPSTWYIGRTTSHEMWAWYSSGYQPLGSVELVWLGGPQCGSFLACFAIDAEWSAATGESYLGRYTDRYRVVGATTYGTGVLEIDFTGIAGYMADVAGPTAATGGSVSTWSATVVGDTLSYQYQWLVNGVARPGEHARSFHSDLSWLESGSHTITGIAQLMDQTTDTVTRNVTLSMGAGWTGPTVLAPYETGTWNGFAYSGRDPISCQWWVDGAPESGSSCSLSRSFEPNTTHNLALYVTDARSITAYGGDWPVHVTSGPECCDEVRIPSETNRPRKGGVNYGRP